MKKLKQTYDYNVSTWVTYEVKKRLYEIAEAKDVTMGTLVREIIEKGIGEYNG